MNNVKYFTVGPSEIFPEISDFYKKGTDEKLFSLHHRSNKFTEIFSETVSNLKKFLNLPGYAFFFFSSATECMEKIVINLVEKRSSHFINGFFAERFYNISKQYSKCPEEIRTEFGKSFDTNTEALINKESDIICLTLNETSTGTVIPSAFLKELKKKFPNKLIVLDVVSAVPYYEIDSESADCIFFSVQKGFGMPPGLGVMAVNEECINKADFISRKNKQNENSFNFNKYYNNYLKNQTSYTPNTSSIYILGKICEIMLKKGLNIIREETVQKYNLLNEFISESSLFSHFVKEQGIRSVTTVAIEAVNNPEEIIKKLTEKGFEISTGYGIYKKSQIRIGNFPVHSIGDMKNLITKLKEI